ncbi:hypothetical protein QR680_005527 [Steinernema hermaphroditum]|uniref:Uncharacterized protein n=1 Tax=Steinernema hermaphroditum TaxID=289476 RepID=A0AA39HSB6_9BILA|nr:hypothetical protein QR680_005527 [Steinernema hermaphroditum]
MSSSDDNEDDDHFSLGSWDQFIARTERRYRKLVRNETGDKSKPLPTSSSLPSKKSVCYGMCPTADAQRLVFVSCTQCQKIVRDVGIAHHLKLRHNFRPRSDTTDLCSDSGDDYQGFLLSPTHNPNMPSTSADVLVAPLPAPLPATKLGLKSPAVLNDPQTSYRIEQKKELVLRISKRAQTKTPSDGGEASVSDANRTKSGSKGVTMVEETVELPTKNAKSRKRARKAPEPKEKKSLDSQALKPTVAEAGESTFLPQNARVHFVDDDASLPVPTPIHNGIHVEDEPDVIILDDEDSSPSTSGMGFPIAPPDSAMNGHGRRKRKTRSDEARSSPFQKKAKLDNGDPSISPFIPSMPSTPGSTPSSNFRGSNGKLRDTPQTRMVDDPMNEPLPSYLLRGPTPNSTRPIYTRRTQDPASNQPPNTAAADFFADVISRNNDISSFYDTPGAQYSSLFETHTAYLPLMKQKGRFFAESGSSLIREREDLRDIRGKMQKTIKGLLEEPPPMPSPPFDLWAQRSSDPVTEVKPADSPEPQTDCKGNLRLKEEPESSLVTTVAVYNSPKAVVKRERPDSSSRCSSSTLSRCPSSSSLQLRSNSADSLNSLKLPLSVESRPPSALLKADQERKWCVTDTYINEEGRVISKPVPDEWAKRDRPPDHDKCFKRWTPGLFVMNRDAKKKVSSLGDRERQSLRSGPRVMFSSSSQTIRTGDSTTYLRSAEMRLESERLKAELNMRKAVNTRKNGSITNIQIGGTASTLNSTTSFNYSASCSTHTYTSEDQMPDHVRRQMEFVQHIQPPNPLMNLQMPAHFISNGQRTTQVTTMHQQVNAPTIFVANGARITNFTTVHTSTRSVQFTRTHRTRNGDNMDALPVLVPQVPLRNHHTRMVQHSTRHGIPSQPVLQIYRPAYNHDDMPVLEPQHTVQFHSVVNQALSEATRSCSERFRSSITHATRSIRVSRTREHNSGRNPGVGIIRVAPNPY